MKINSILMIKIIKIDALILIMKLLCKYFINRNLEKKALNMQKNNLKTYVICPGVIYGNGE